MNVHIFKLYVERLVDFTELVNDYRYITHMIQLYNMFDTVI